MQRHSHPFVPSLDENFKSWFEKDSFGQRGHLNAVLTRILEESAFFKDRWLPNTLPQLRTFAMESIIDHHLKTYFRRYALFTGNVFVEGNKFLGNPIKLISTPATGMAVKIPNARDLVKVTGHLTTDVVHTVRNNGEAFVKRPGKVVCAWMDFSIVVGWKAMIKSIFPTAINGGLGEDSGGLRSYPTIMVVTSQLLYSGTYRDYENTLQRRTETPRQVDMNSSRDVGVLRSKERFCLNDPDTKLLVFSSVETLRQVLVELPTQEAMQVASVQYIMVKSHGNSVINYRQRHGTSTEQHANFDNAILNAKTELLI
ncbi:hypothetical protein HOY82DRAFT_635226 [Tuber indicum]|nr:hypothetical protein HOY82DRAFT_635226 [Tuber indicum]